MTIDANIKTTNSTPLLRLNNVRIDFEGTPTLRDVNLELLRGDFMTVTGPNGGGKTTLLRTMLKLLKPNKGSVEYFDAEGKSTKRLRIGYLPQKSEIDTHFPITVEEVVLSGLYHGLRPRIGSAEKARLDEILEIVGADGFRLRTLHGLSGGQLQRTLLGRALISRPELLVLDEPLSYVDKEFERQIYGLVSEASHQATIVLVSHEMSVISTMATRHIIVEGGNVRACHSEHHHYISPCDK